MPKTTHKFESPEEFLSAIAELDAKKRMCHNAVLELISALATVLNSEDRELMGPYIVGDESGIEVPDTSSTDRVRMHQAILALTNGNKLRKIDLGNSMTSEELAVLYEAGCLDEDCGEYVTEETILVDSDDENPTYTVTPCLCPNETMAGAEGILGQVNTLKIFEAALSGSGQGADRVKWNSFEFKLDSKASRTASAEIGRILHDFDYQRLEIGEIADELLKRCSELNAINNANNMPAICAIVGYCLGRIEPDAT